MGLLDGLEVFGMKTDNVGDDLFSEKKPEVRQVKEEHHEQNAPKEEDFLLTRHITCPICDHKFTTLAMKTGRARRLESDPDLRPRNIGIDPLKYNVICCPICGYAALNMNQWFEALIGFQKNLIKEQVSKNFQSASVSEAFGVKTWDYEISIALHKLSLFNAVVKKAKTSEKAYNCLVLAWLYRGYAEEMEETEDSKAMYAREIRECRKMEKEYYKEAYDGLTQAMATERPPVCGMDEQTLNYLLAVMARSFGQLDVSSKLVAKILVSQTAGSKIKDKARDLKEAIIQQLKAGK